MIRAEEVRARVSIASILNYYQLQPNRAGYISCPFHGTDRTPSLKIYDDQNSWHCFGCDRGGSVIDFVMNYENLAFTDAIRWIGERFGLEPSATLDPKRERLRRARIAHKRQQVEKEREASERQRTALYSRIGELRRLVDGDPVFTDPATRTPEKIVEARSALDDLIYRIEGED